MFDISKDQLLRLSDVDLRELVARLCEAELSRAGAPVSAVRWGGPQTAPDGGLDVDVQVRGEGYAGDFVPRAWTGIQVKKSSMPAGAIANEMSPENDLRPIFSELARHNGCYIIVSLTDDPAGTRLGDREKAMQAQVESIKDQGDLRVEFYGRGRLADWLRQHPGVQLWVRRILALPLSGWRPHERWSITPRGDEDDLICEAGVVIRLPGREQDELGVVQGIEGIRELVKDSEKAVRIVGLSGVGKSRIVQALFEDAVGDEPLDRHLAIYADLGEAPDPPARTVLERLAAEGHPAIMVLDNCPSDAHSRIAGQVASLPSLRLITIEFDIREDKPETTSVVRIDAEGPEIAETLIKRRYPDLGPVNARRIAEISDGNARVALALADVANEVKESLSSFSDAQLFERLFYQRGAPDTDLLKAAEVLAFVYSFSISPDEEGVDELATLAALLDQGRDRRVLYRAAQTLVDRQLVQKRGNWRAILPHAVSNRLAAKALLNIPVDDIVNAFQGLPSLRLLKSFGRRLGFLHDHVVAQEIVKSWLSPGGLLHDLHRLNDDDIQLLQNVAPAAPKDVLSTIEAQNTDGISETFFSRKNPHFSTFVDLLTAIAYDTDLFERCVTFLAKFALTEEEGEKTDRIQDRLFGLFSLCLSGTEASPDARENLARRFLMSGDRDKQRLGLGMLRAALQSRRWFVVGTFEFGARPRGFGYQPKTPEERDQWFKRFIALVQEAAMGGGVRLSTQVRDLLADELQGLWRSPGLRTTLADLARILNDQRPWLEGWQAVQEIKHYNDRKANVEAAPRDGELLDELDEILKPKDLSDKIRAYVLSASYKLSVEETSRKRIAYHLGTAITGEPQAMDELLPDFFTARFGCLIEFGRGMASPCSDLRALWNQLVEGLERAGDQTWQCDVLEGVLKVIHQRNEPLAQRILDESVQNHLLRKYIVDLHLSVPLDHTGVARLHRSLGFDDIPLRQFEKLAWHRLPDIFSETDVRDLMLRMLDKPDGARIVLGGLAKRLHTSNDDKPTLSPDLKRFGLCASATLLRHVAHHYDGSSAYFDLSVVLASCLDEAEFPEETGEVFDMYLKCLKAWGGQIHGIEEAVVVLAEKATFRFLDTVFYGPGIEGVHRYGIFHGIFDEKNPLSGVCVETLLAWCRRGNFQERLVMISEAIYPFEKGPDSDGVVLSEQARAIIEAAQDSSTVLRNLGFSVYHSSGVEANIIAKRRQAFETLLKHDRPDVRAAAETQIAEIKRREEQERRYERENDRQHEQRFE